MLGEPRGERLSVPVRQQIDGSVALAVDEDTAVDVPLLQGEIIDA